MLNEITYMGRRFVNRLTARRASHALHALDSRMLKDIGLHRSHITMIANGVDRPYRRAA
mgnify:CR=1 FL=1|jgi:uncharacterized protein YjiS (DUF1127 family)